MSARSADAQERPMAGVNKWLVAFVVMLPTLIEVIDTSIVNVSLDHIRGSLSAGIDEATWTISAYLVSNAIVIPMSGWLSRLFGRKNYQIGSIVLFTVSSFMCGAAWNLQSLIFFRILQGLGGGGLVPISQAILLEAFPPVEHGMAMAIFGVGVMFGPIVGPILGGWITDNWSWRWIFYINIPIGILSIAMNYLVIQDPSYMKRIKMKIDYAGLVLLAAGLGSLQFILDKGQREDWFASPLIITFAIVSFVSLGFLIINELYTEQPVVNLKLFRDRTFGNGCAVMFFVFFNLFGSIIVLPIFLQTLMGYSAYDAGMVLGPGGIATLICMPIAGMLISRVNPKAVLGVGIVICGLTTFLMSKFNAQTDFWHFVWPRVTLGIGMGFTFIPLTTLTLSHIRKEMMGQASAIYNLLRNLGGSVGIAFVTTMVSRRTQANQVNLVSHLTAYDPNYVAAKAKLAAGLALKGQSYLPPDMVIQNELLRQSSLLAYNETFLTLSVMMIGVLGLVFFMERSAPISRT